MTVTSKFHVTVQISSTTPDLLLIP